MKNLSLVVFAVLRLFIFFIFLILSLRGVAFSDSLEKLSSLTDCTSERLPEVLAVYRDDPRLVLSKFLSPLLSAALLILSVEATESCLSPETELFLLLGLCNCLLVVWLKSSLRLKIFLRFSFLVGDTILYFFAEVNSGLFRLNSLCRTTYGFS